MKYTILFFAPFYTRSGYGLGARSMVLEWRNIGMNIRIIPLDKSEPGIDDIDIKLFQQLESTPISGQPVAVFYHVPSQHWIDISLPAGSLRVLMTTFEGAIQGEQPPKDWIIIANQMDQIWLAKIEQAAWISAGIRPKIVRDLKPPHHWIHDPIPRHADVITNNSRENYQFISIAMYQPRRRWDTLIEAFFEEFKNESNLELYLKVNWPTWHPIPGKPQADLRRLVESSKIRHHGRCRVTIDDDLGTRTKIRSLIDSSNCYVSTDSVASAPITESLMRGKIVIAPISVSRYLPNHSSIAITEDPDLRKPIDEETLHYQPHHRGKSVQLLRVMDVRNSLRQAYEFAKTRSKIPWDGWKEHMEASENSARNWAQYFSREIEAMVLSPQSAHPGVIWEGSQFVYHSLAHVNRQLCWRLLIKGSLNLSIKPYEVDQFDPQNELPEMAILLNYVNKRLSNINVHVRHQWPPNFKPPESGAWVMIQPWEFGGIPLEWVQPMRDMVDEIWVPTNWVKNCYVDSGIPAEKVKVIPNGVDLRTFSPDGANFPLKTQKSFKFLFVGGSIYRKGIDVVLNSYAAAFSSNDDVVLVIKDQSGNTYGKTGIREQLAKMRARRPDLPEVEYICDPLTEAQIASLYRSCNILVHPYRGEGYGLPIAEAMSCGVPVIVTQGGAADDFVTSEVGHLIPATRRPTRVQSFNPSAPGFWLLEPDADSVIKVMQSAFKNTDLTTAMGRRARSHALKNLSWNIAVDLTANRISALSEVTPLRLRTKSTAFMVDTDIGSTCCMEEIITSYVAEFKKDEAVALCFIVANDNLQSTTDKVTNKIANILTELNIIDFPEIRIISSARDVHEIVKHSTLLWVDNEPGSLVGLDGAIGHRLGASRLRFRQFIRETQGKI